MTWPVFLQPRQAAWLAVLALSLGLLLLGLPYLDDLRDAARNELMQQRQRTARMQEEQKALTADAQEEARLRAELGPDAWQKLLAPPPRAQLVADLRQFGIEAGLRDFNLTLGNAVPAQETLAAHEAWKLTMTAITIKAAAPSDRQIFAFTARTIKELPGYIRLEKMIVRRREAQDAAGGILIEAEMTLNWLGFADEAEIARARP